VVEFLYAVVREEDALEARAVLEPVHCLYQVASQVQLCQRDQPVQVLNRGDQVVREVQDTKLRQVIDVFYFCDLIRVEIEHVQLIQVLQVSNSLYVILA
jgi:hypothetical protein